MKTVEAVIRHALHEGISVHIIPNSIIPDTYDVLFCKGNYHNSVTINQETLKHGNDSDKDEMEARILTEALYRLNACPYEEIIKRAKEKNSKN